MALNNFGARQGFLYADTRMIYKKKGKGWKIIPCLLDILIVHSNDEGIKPSHREADQTSYPAYSARYSR